ncbi:hypothetical protein GPECTOR_25g432 [Gonium pectorale]|uniref:Ubiquitin-like protease family profile domain-containing protein n=1 Tax=Gonium pectorale TaxID=33097 RepID=A0A150GG81_GONPE|nr:hypothetical protein GPECTOR_25g432 [Gonium pectorale]|eukprot:KXZ48847.1 hypothetical protein GPECTOR_25g432 [Gonium pectorale]
MPIAADPCTDTPLSSSRSLGAAISAGVGAGNDGSALAATPGSTARGGGGSGSGADGGVPSALQVAAAGTPRLAALQAQRLRPEAVVARTPLGPATNLQDLTNRDLGRLLRSGTWLNDEVINYYMLLIRAPAAAPSTAQPPSTPQQPPPQLRTPAAAAASCPAAASSPASPVPPCLYVFSSFFWSKLTGGGARGRFEYGEVQRWTLPRRSYTPDCVLGRELLLFPINHGNAHWCLAAVWPRRRLLQYFDSLGGSRATSDWVLGTLLRWLLRDAEDKGLDGSSCGVFACAFAELLARGVPAEGFRFSQADMPSIRRGMAEQILRGSL